MRRADRPRFLSKSRALSIRVSNSWRVKWISTLAIVWYSGSGKSNRRFGSGGHSSVRPAQTDGLRHDEDEQGSDGRDCRIDLLADTLPHSLGQRLGGGPADEERDHQLVERGQEGEEGRGQDRRSDRRERDPPKRSRGRRAQNLRCTLKARIHAPQRTG